MCDIHNIYIKNVIIVVRYACHNCCMTRYNTSKIVNLYYRYIIYTTKKYYINQIYLSYQGHHDRAKPLTIVKTLLYITEKHILEYHKYI